MKIFVKAEVKKALYMEKSTAQLLDQLGMKRAGSRIDANFPDTIVEKGVSSFVEKGAEYLIFHTKYLEISWKNRFRHLRCPDLMKGVRIIGLFQGFVTVLIG
ncbi:hypothetical protein [Peribacillus simplex]|uniref:hypothetical protein n=1 Tax=Peribacillus simplex TaxID=1478 RepID=UPI0011A7B8A4|nr:hypothetical protein [Peribacillus simplex]